MRLTRKRSANQATSGQDRPSHGSLSRLERLVLGAAGVGIAVSAVVAAVSLYVIATTPAATAPVVAGRLADSEDAGHGDAERVHVEVDARHRGKLRVDLRASVTLQGKELGKADVAAYVDMKQMPGAHAIGPLSLTEVPGKPGVYETSAQVPMVGDYEVRVEVSGPARGEGRKGFTVATVSDGTNQRARRAAVRTVRVVATDFAFRPAKLRLAPGRYRFVLVNEGRVLHDLSLAPPDAGSHHAHLAKAEAGPGQKDAVEVTLAPGVYEVMCHVPGHFEAGMRGTVTVTRG